MGKLVQVVPLSGGSKLFLYGLTKKGELVFKSSKDPSRLQTESFVTDEKKVYLNLYYFPIEFLNKVKNNIVL